MKKKYILCTIITLFILLLESCYTPSPLYGVWADDSGNKITFMTDGSFSAAIKNAENGITQYEGTYTVIDNVLNFNIKGDSTYTRNTQWDLYGAILKLTWTSDSNTVNLILYHTKR